MTVFLATTLVALYRGSKTDEFGDDSDSNTIVASDLPASIVEDGQRRFRPAEQRGTVVERYTVRLRPDADVREGDRLVVQDSGVVYQVQDVTRPHSVIGFADIRVSAVRVGARSVTANSS